MKRQITPAALGALVNGDLENFMVASTPGGIEAQEAQGQRDLCASERLPKEMRVSRSELEKAWGVKFLEDADDLFVNVQLPKGWKLKPTDHSMWSRLVDDKDRERAAIFYKAAFYGRSAHMSVVPRFGCSVDYDRRDKEGVAVCNITDGGKVIHSTEPVSMKGLQSWEGSQIAGKLAEEWLNDKYPEWRSPFAYWD